MNPKDPPLLKWYDPGPLDEPPEVAEMMDYLGYRNIMPKDKDEGDDKTLG